MEIHPAFVQLIDRFRHKEIHAAHSGRELMRALRSLVVESQANSWGEMQAEIELALDQLFSHMLAYAPPMNVLHRFLVTVARVDAEGESLDELKSAVSDLASGYQVWSNDARARIAEIAFQLIHENSIIFTFTLSETVLTTLSKVWGSGKKFRVRVTESRPNNDGLITAKRLADLGVPVDVSIDACIPDLLRDADLMIGGAEAITMEGSAICKTGTYLAALTACEFGVPFYILADTMKFDVSSMYGFQPKFDPIIRNDFLDLADESDIHISGHLFDSTPAELIRSVVTERGIISPTGCVEIMRHMPVSEVLLEQLRSLDG
jgi:translation initiation factor 2B subunit (eIF-2B alpha/beta/delta family)